MLPIYPFARAATRAVYRVLGCAALVLLVKLSPAAASAPPGAVDAARLRAADSEPQNWFTGGRDQDGTYYSPLATIDAGNVEQLGFAWSYDLGDPMRGQEATPIVIDGVMYTSGTWGYVYAVDAASGQGAVALRPEGRFLCRRNPCCDLVNRGVAVWKGKVYVASVDGRLHALDAATGRKTLGGRHHHRSQAAVLEHRRSADRRQRRGHRQQRLPTWGTAPCAATCPPTTWTAGRSNGGSSRCRRASGSPGKSGIWRRPTKPGIRIAQRNSRAARTAWDGFAYDPDLNLVYFGTANAAPYDLRQLGPAKLDSLYTASIIAVHADTGRLAWYYQTTPHDTGITTRCRS